MSLSTHKSSAYNPQKIVQQYFDRRYHVVFWPDVGIQKGPTEEGWPTKSYTLDDYTPQSRVGLVTGTEIESGHHLHDVDIDWAPGYKIALQFLPKTEFVYGRNSKYVSHCFYTLPESLSRIVFADPVDKTTLIEIRGTKADGELGFQSMVPPSVWSDKDGNREQLEFRFFNPDGSFGTPAHVESVQHFKQRVGLGAIGMLFAKHFGYNGFGHEVRLCWAGYLLRAGVSIEDCVTMGEAISIYCNNREVADVRRTIESTAAALENESKKVKGGPALARIIGRGSGTKIIAEINRWLGRDSDFVRTSDGLILKDHQDNIKRAIALFNVELSYQEFAEKIMVREADGPLKNFDDRILNNLWLRIDREHRFRPSFQFYERVVTDAAYDNVFHPVRDYLHSVAWDGTPRIDTWLADYGGAEDTQENSEEQTYLEAVSSIVLIAAVRRIMHPGCKYDEMLVLESPQGFNKSSALRSLCPYDEWFSDDLPLNCDAKEIIERTLGKWLIEASDLVGGRKADRDHLKSMMSRQVDGPARMAYARISVERARQFIIIGTTNPGDYLMDPTGARRFWPVKVKRFLIDQIVKDRDQLWAEAVHREAKGESIRLSQHLWDAAGLHQEQRREVDAWEDVLQEFTDTLHASATGQQHVSADALWGKLNIATERRDRSGAKRISEIMQRMGFTRTTVRENDRVKTGYTRTLTSDQLTRLREVEEERTATNRYSLE